tara:strand:+ start:58 stop:474 length:417 start_codon:yes stop_codon:yes gene_type:complete
MKIEDIKPNSVEAIICFVLYICAQDKEISEHESVDVFSKILNLVKMDTEINTNMSKNELEIFISEAHNYFLSKSDWQNKKMANEEMEFFEKNISEEDSSRLALRIARICASTDGFHKKENAKFLKWSKFLLNKNKKDE